MRRSASLPSWHRLREHPAFADGVAVALLVIAIIALMLPALLPGRALMTFDPGRWAPWSATAVSDEASPSFNADHARFVLPRTSRLRQAWMEGEIPLWDPSSFAGNPFLALWQTQVLYPVNLGLLLVDARAWLGWQVTLHLLLAGIGMFLLCRSLGLVTGAALLAAIAFSFGGHMILRLAHPSFIATSAWLPWTLLGVEGFCNRRRPVWLMLLALAWTMMILAGQATLVVFFAYFLAGWIGLRVWTHGRHRLRLLAFLGGAIVAGSLLAAPQLLPSLELSRRSGRAERPVEALQRSTMPAKQMVQFVAPEVFGSVKNASAFPGKWLQGFEQGRFTFAAALTGYVGTWLPLLALVGLVGGPWKGRRTFLTVTCLLGLGVALGTLFPLAHRLLPGFRFSVANRTLYLFSFAVIILAARGAHVAASGSLSRARLSGLATAGLVLTLGLWLWIRYGWLPEFPLETLPARSAETAHAALTRFLLLGLAGSGLLFAAAWLPSRDRWAGIGNAGLRRAGWWTAVLIFLGLELLSFAAPYRVTRPREQVFPATEDLQWLSENAGDWRVGRYEPDQKGPPQQGLARANTLALFGLREPGGFAPLHPADLNLFLQAAGWERDTSWGVRAASTPETFTSPLFRLLAVRYVLALPDATIPGLTRIRHGDLSVWEVPEPLPTAFLVPATRAVESVDEALGHLTRTGFDPAGLATVEGVPALEDSAGGQAPDSPGEVRLVRRTFNSIELQVEAQRAGWLVLSEAWAPGWEVQRDDGSTSPSIRTDGILQGTGVAAGSQRLTFIYRPGSFRLGLWTAAAGAVLLAAVGFLPRRFPVHGAV